MNPVEDRLQAAMSAAADLAAQEIRNAPPLRLPPSPAIGVRRGRPSRRWIRWGAPLTAAAVVVALAVTLVIVKSVQNESAVTPIPAAPTGSAAPTGLGGAPRYYVANSSDRGLVVGDSVTGKTLATFAPPAHSLFWNIAAADDDRTFVVLALKTSLFQQSSASSDKTAPATGTWFELRLAPGTAHPARLTPLPIEPQTVHGLGGMQTFATALSGSGKELAVTEATASGGLAVKVFSVATGRLVHTWTTNDPSLSQVKVTGIGTQGLAGQPALTWIDGDRQLALETTSTVPVNEPNHKDQGKTRDIARELNVAGPSGDLLADSEVVWDVQTWDWENPAATLLQSCAAQTLSAAHLISADGTTFGCLAVTGPNANPNLSFLTFPLATGSSVAGKARIDYQVTQMGKKAVSTVQVLWVSPSGDALIGAWTTYQKGTLEDAPNGLHIGVMSNGKFTPLRFPPGFDRKAQVRSITW